MECLSPENIEFLNGWLDSARFVRAMILLFLAGLAVLLAGLMLVEGWKRVVAWSKRKAALAKAVARHSSEATAQRLRDSGW